MCAECDLACFPIDGLQIAHYGIQGWILRAFRASRGQKP